MSDTTNKALAEIAQTIETKRADFIKIQSRIKAILIDNKVTSDEKDEYDLLIAEQNSIKPILDKLETQFIEKSKTKDFQEELKMPVIEVIDSEEKLQKAKENLVLIEDYHNKVIFMSVTPGSKIIVDGSTYHMQDPKKLHAKLDALTTSIQEQIDGYKKSDDEITSLEEAFTALDNIYASFEEKSATLTKLLKGASDTINTLSELKKIVPDIYSAIEQYEFQKSSRNYDNHKDTIVIYDTRIKEIKLKLEAFEASLPSLENTAMEKTSLFEELKHFDEIWQHLKEIEHKYELQKEGEKASFESILIDLNQSRKLLKQLHEAEKLDWEELKKGSDFIEQLQIKIEETKAQLIINFGDVKDISPEDIKSGKAAAPSLNRIKELKNNTLNNLQNIATELNSFCNHWEKAFLDITTAFSNGRAVYKKQEGEQEALEKNIGIFWSILQDLTLTLIAAPIGTASAITVNSKIKKQAESTTKTLIQKLKNIDNYYPDIAKDLGKSVTKIALSTVIKECIKNGEHSQIKIPSSQYLTSGIEKLNILKVDKAHFYLHLKSSFYEEYIQLNTVLKELHQRIEAYYRAIPKDVYFYAIYHDNLAVQTKKIETQFLSFASEVDILSEKILQKISLSKPNVPSKLQDDFELFCWAAYISTWEIHNLAGNTAKSFLADKLIEYLDKKGILKNWGKISKEDFGNDLEQLWASTTDSIVGVPVTDVGKSALSLVQGAKKQLKYYLSDKFWREKLNL